MIIHYIVEEDIFVDIVFLLFFIVFITKEILKRHIKDCIKINGKQRIIMPEKVNMLNSKILKERQPLMIYADFESILVPKDKESKF